MRWQERNIGTVENVDSDDGKDQGDNEQVQVHLTFDPDTGLYLRERGEQEGGVGPGSRMGAREQEGEHTIKETDRAKSLTTFSVLSSFAGKIRGGRNRTKTHTLTDCEAGALVSKM